MDQTKSRLLTVQETFLIEGRGVVVTPGIPVDSYSGSLSCPVTLRTPDGRERTVGATFDIPRVSPGPSNFYLCLLTGLTTDDVPIGTEIWTDENRV